MANIDMTLRRILASTVLVCLVLVWLVGYFHTAAKMRQGQRELNYLYARQLVTQERNERLERFKKDLEQKRRTQEYNRGRVVDYGRK